MIKNTIMAAADWLRFGGEATHRRSKSASAQGQYKWKICIAVKVSTNEMFLVEEWKDTNVIVQTCSPWNWCLSVLVECAIVLFLPPFMPVDGPAWLPELQVPPHSALNSWKTVYPHRERSTRCLGWIRVRKISSIIFQQAATRLICSWQKLAQSYW